jgi:hypothetical protein
VENTRGRGRPRLTWAEAVKRDLRDWKVPKDLALDRTAWKSVINVTRNLSLLFFLSLLVLVSLCFRWDQAELDAKCHGHQIWHANILSV